MVGYAAYDEDFAEFRRDHTGNYLARVQAHPWGARALEGALLASPVLGMSGIRGYYRTPYGPGWALIGDAVHQKDPIVARGLNEALRGAEWLANALHSGISDDALDDYARTMRERTESKALNARMLMRPDRYMTPEQAAILSEATATPEGLAQYLRVEYDDAVHFDAFFAKAER
jgi:flavin-dependent dehydrogenase